MPGILSCLERLRYNHICHFLWLLMPDIFLHLFVIIGLIGTVVVGMMLWKKGLLALLMFSECFKQGVLAVQPLCGLVSGKRLSAHCKLRFGVYFFSSTLCGILLSGMPRNELWNALNPKWNQIISLQSFKEQVMAAATFHFQGNESNLSILAKYLKYNCYSYNISLSVASR